MEARPVTFAGIDLDSNNIHVVRLNLDDDHAVYNRIRLDDSPGDYHQRARRLRDLMPARTAWNDHGVVQFAIEEPKTAPGHGGLQSAVPQAVLRGALLSCLPTDVPILMLPPYEWKKWSLGAGEAGKGNAKKPEIHAWAAGRWPNPPDRPTQDVWDAYAIAWAARALCDHHATNARRTAA